MLKIKVYLLFLFLLTTAAHAESTLSLRPAFALPIGNISESIGYGFGADVFLNLDRNDIDYNLSWLPWDMQPMFAFSFISFPVLGASGSSVFSMHLWGGLTRQFRLLPRLDLMPFIGGGMYFARLNMTGRGETDALLNPLLATGVSLRYLVHRAVFIEITQTFQMQYVGTPFSLNSSITSLGISYRFAGYRGENKTDISTQLKDSIEKNYEAGKYTKAEAEINALEKINSNDLMIDKYRSLIYQQRLFKNAQKLEEENNYFRALQILDTIADLPEAAALAANLRTKLEPQLKNLVELGILAYNKNDFLKCINYMEKVKIIDPNHEDAKVYLPRARNRYKALQNLR